MTALPLLLAGPLLRRVDAHSVSVWAAFREPCQVSLALFEGRQRSTGPGTAESGQAVLPGPAVRTRRLGARLHVALARVGSLGPEDAGATPLPAPHLRPGTIYSYDLLVSPEGGGGPLGLLGMGLLEDDPKGEDNARAIADVSPDAPRHLALGYGDRHLPSFATLAPTLPETRIAHASCRKAHGPGTDALSWLDDRVKAALDKPLERVQQLFLTGDQIYADDVPSALLPMLHRLGNALLGTAEDPDAGEEELPTEGGGGTGRVTLRTAPPMRRTVLVRGEGGFTSVEAQNHLLTFGEYAAMYLAAWSPRAWGPLGTLEDRIATARSEPTEPQPFRLTRLEPLVLREGEDEGRFAEKMRERLGPGFEAERQRLLVYAATVPKVARVLANIPSYMIFDDHDVTDDWNINATWRNRVFARPLGRAVVRSALLAYAWFQAWGSDPAAFLGDTPNARLLQAGEAWLASTRDRPADQAAVLDGLFGLTPGAAERARFHYEAPGLLHTVRVLDSRTRRSYPFSTGVHPPSLLGESLEEQLPPGPLPAGKRLLLVVASTPVLGPEVLERMLVPVAIQALDLVQAAQRPEDDTQSQPEQPGRHGSALGLASARTPGALFVDAETWPSNEPAQQELLARLAGYERVVVLGGDVHYGLNLALDWWDRDRAVGDPSRRAARILQLTTSAARNAFEKRIEAIYRGYHWLNLWMAGSVIETVAWKERPQLALPASGLSLLRRLRLAEEPVLLPTLGWPPGTAEQAEDEPDWAWRLHTLRDTRPDAERGGAVAEAAEEISEGLTEAAGLPRGLDRARRLAALHAKARSESFAPLREVVFTNNIGLLRFEEDAGGGAITVVHELLSTTEKGYPEDETDTELPARRPLGKGARLSEGAGHTLVRAPLAVQGTRPRLGPGVA